MNSYVESIMLADRVYRLFLENVKHELQICDIQDITHIQALILYNIGHDSIAVSELIYRKYFLGSNITYNLKKMAEAGYIHQVRSDFDKRSVHVSLTEKGLKLYNVLECAFQRYLQTIEKTQLSSFSAIAKDMEVILMSQKR